MKYMKLDIKSANINGMSTVVQILAQQKNMR